MTTLLDTNVLVYASDSQSPRHSPCLQVVQEAIGGRLDAVLVPQVLLELYASVTKATALRPLTPAQGWQQVDALSTRISVLPVKVDCLSFLAQLVIHHQLGGPRIFDLFLAAQVKSHGIDRLCTDNVRHFDRLDIHVLTPEEVLQSL